MSFEPYKSKMIELIRCPSLNTRKKLIKKIGYNVFNLRSSDILIDLLTDSGTSAMSDEQWAAMIRTHQSYAGSESYYSLDKAVNEIFGFPFFIPVHQGRAAEHILFTCMKVKHGKVVPNNNHFDTTRANVKFLGGQAIDFVISDAYCPERNISFKGNMDVDRLKDFVRKNKGRIPLIMTTITNNTIGGQPVSMENIKETSEVAKDNNIPFIIDSCRFAENAYFIKTRESGYKNTPIRKIIYEMLSYADGITFSGKKDALTNIGGLIATRDEELYEKLREMEVIVEGFPTYGGMACRELAAMSVGLYEATDENYLKARCGQVEYLWSKLNKAQIPIVKPAGGHGVFVDGKKFFEGIIPQEQFPSQTLTVELYIASGVRAVELGTSVFGETDPKTGKIIKLPKLDLMRLAIPRRVYTNLQMEYVAENIIDIYNKRERIKGLERVYAPANLGHFLARFERIK